jgi:hypothetical protein
MVRRAYCGIGPPWTGDIGTSIGSGREKPRGSLDRSLNPLGALIPSDAGPGTQLRLGGSRTNPSAVGGPFGLPWSSFARRSRRIPARSPTDLPPSVSRRLPADLPAGCPALRSGHVGGYPPVRPPSPSFPFDVAGKVDQPHKRDKSKASLFFASCKSDFAIRSPARSQPPTHPRPDARPWEGRHARNPEKAMTSEGGRPPSTPDTAPS